MDNEARKKIIQWVLYARHSTMEDGWLADRILEVLEGLGYRKLPKDKPKIVAWAMEDVSRDIANELILRQWEADIRHYEGK